MTETIVFAENYGLAYTVFGNPYNEADDVDVSEHFETNIARFHNEDQDLTTIACGITFQPYLKDTTNKYLDNSPSTYDTLSGHGESLVELSKVANVIQGYFYVPESGEYTLGITGNDIAYIFIASLDGDPTQAFDNWTSPAFATDIGPTPISVYDHRIELGNLTKGDLWPMTFIFATTLGSGDITGKPGYGVQVFTRVYLTLPDKSTIISEIEFEGLFVLPQGNDTQLGPDQPTSASDASVICPDPPE